jgi:hypothetical protein
MPFWLIIDRRTERNGTRGGVGRFLVGGNHLFFPAAASSAISLHVPILEAQHFGLLREIESVNNFFFFFSFSFFKPHSLWYNIESNHVWLVYTITLGVYISAPIVSSRVIVLVMRCGVASDSISVVHPVCTTSVECTHIQMRWMMDGHLRSPARLTSPLARSEGRLHTAHTHQTLVFQDKICCRDPGWICFKHLVPLKDTLVTCYRLVSV